MFEDGEEIQCERMKGNESMMLMDYPYENGSSELIDYKQSNTCEIK